MKMLSMTLPDGSKWAVPVEMIARNRAAHYAHEFGGDIQRSLAEDTMPLFDNDPYEIADWAVNNMNWCDFLGHQRKLANATEPDWHECWNSCSKEVVEVAE